MFWFVTKKKFNEEKNKIKNSFVNRDKKIVSNKRILERLRDKLQTYEIKMARLEGVIAHNKEEIDRLRGNTNVSIPQVSSPSQSKLETRVVNRFRKNKSALIMAEIEKLIPYMRIPEILNIIVKDKELCSKATFYRYISSLRSQGLIDNETDETKEETDKTDKETDKA